jgi:urease accessory protein
MGSPAVRITAKDFVTPPEFAAWSLAQNPAGRVGGVRFELVGDGSRTRLGDCYQQVPLRLLPPFPFRGQQAPVLVYLLNPTAGLMDGDGQYVEIRVRPGSRAVVVGQSATRIHPALFGFSTQQWRIRVESDAILVVLPGPAIPFRGCRYYQDVQIDLDEGASVVWGDLWFAGRYARGAASEQFQFDRVIQQLSVRRADRLVFRDRFGWRGPWDLQEAGWHFGNAPACGSLFVSTGYAIPSVQDCGLSPACFTTTAGDTCLRWCGGSEEVTAALVRAALDAGSCPQVFGEHDLAPNHWFSPVTA